MALALGLTQTWFKTVHHRNLVYNACWEDPRIDRIALDLGPDDTVLVITSAGCNALDYALTGPKHIYAVDVNRRQNALLELKLAGIRALDFDPFFQFFGEGYCPQCNELYERELRPQLSESAREFWDRRITFFAGAGPRGSFYFRGSAGLVAYLVNLYIDRVARIRREIDALLEASSVEEQQALYYSRVRTMFWSRFVRWMFGRDTVLSLLGVPEPQISQVARHYVGGIAQFIEECLEYVFASLPIRDNYFWRVYLTGRYSRTCCPEYLRAENFLRLKAGLADRVSVHTCSVQQFLEKHDGTISRFVLLDHMDWLSTTGASLLQQEWQAIVDRASPGARVIWRSGSLEVDYVDPIPVRVRGRRRRVGDLLRYNTQLARELHLRDRVHTYGSFSIADLPAV